MCAEIQVQQHKTASHSTKKACGRDGGTMKNEINGVTKTGIKGKIRGDMDTRNMNAARSSNTCWHSMYRGDEAQALDGGIDSIEGAMLIKTWAVQREWAAPVQRASHECKSARSLIFKSGRLNTEAWKVGPILQCPHKELHCSLFSLEVIHIRSQHS